MKSILSPISENRTIVPDDLQNRPGRLLLDEFAVLAMMPSDMALEAAPLLAAIREELLRRLEQVQP
jgi:hypothetical protein